MILIINHKTLTMTVQQFYKQALIFADSFSLIFYKLMTKIAGSWNLVLNSGVMKYFKSTQNFSTRPLFFFCLEFYVITSPIHFSSFFSSLCYDFMPCSDCSALHRTKVKNKKCFLSLLKLNNWVWDLYKVILYTK